MAFAEQMTNTGVTRLSGRLAIQSQPMSHPLVNHTSGAGRYESLLAVPPNESNSSHHSSVDSDAYSQDDCILMPPPHLQPGFQTAAVASVDQLQPPVVLERLRSQTLPSSPLPLPVGQGNLKLPTNTKTPSIGRTRNSRTPVRRKTSPDIGMDPKGLANDQHESHATNPRADQHESHVHLAAGRDGPEFLDQTDHETRQRSVSFDLNHQPTSMSNPMVVGLDKVPFDMAMLDRITGINTVDSSYLTPRDCTVQNEFEVYLEGTVLPVHAAPARLKLAKGDEVALSANYRQCGNAENGPLEPLDNSEIRPQQKGILVDINLQPKDGPMLKVMVRQVRGKEQGFVSFWYPAAALMRIGGPTVQRQQTPQSAPPSRMSVSRAVPSASRENADALAPLDVSPAMLRYFNTSDTDDASPGNQYEQPVLLKDQQPVPGAVPGAVSQPPIHCKLQVEAVHDSDPSFCPPQSHRGAAVPCEHGCGFASSDSDARKVHEDICENFYINPHGGGERGGGGAAAAHRRHENGGGVLAAPVNVVSGWRGPSDAPGFGEDEHDYVAPNDEHVYIAPNMYTSHGQGAAQINRRRPRQPPSRPPRVSSLGIAFQSSSLRETEPPKTAPVAASLSPSKSPLSSTDQDTHRAQRLLEMWQAFLVNNKGADGCYMFNQTQQPFRVANRLQGRALGCSPRSTMQCLARNAHPFRRG